MPFWRRKPKEPGPPRHGPDFSGVDSRDKVLSMVKEGVLEPLYLMPAEFGGGEHPQNIVYVPKGIGDIKRHIDVNIIAPLIQDGSVQYYSATPEYRGKSLVPMAIQVTASDPKSFQTEIAVWGEALDRQPENSG